MSDNIAFKASLVHTKVKTYRGKEFNTFIARINFSQPKRLKEVATVEFESTSQYDKVEHGFLKYI